MLKYGQPTRERDVLRYIGLVMVWGPDPHLVARIKELLADPPKNTRAPRFWTLAEWAKRCGFYLGGNPGGYLRLSLIEAGVEGRWEGD